MTKSGLKMKGGADARNILLSIAVIAALLATIFIIIFGVYHSRINKVDKTSNPEKYDALYKKKEIFMIIGASFFIVFIVFVFIGEKL